MMTAAMPGPGFRSKTIVLFACACSALPLALAGIAADCQAPGRFSSTLPLLTTTRQAHTLSFHEASRAYPVHLRGVVTFYDPYQEGHPALFIADATGGIFVQIERHPILEVHPGSLVEVSGVTDPGGFAPIILGSEVRVVGGSGPLPKPRLATIPFLLTGAEDGQCVAIEGLVHSVQSEGMHVVLTLTTIDGLITATTVKEDGANYDGLVDSKVLIPGEAAPLMDSKRCVPTGR